jgi:Domain of unknown function (DUF4078)
MADSLYGIKQASKTKVKEISPSNSLAFSSNLASLISKSSSPHTAGAGRPRQPKSKPDIFTAHNRNVKKRAAADAAEQQHKTKDDLGAVDSAILHRSKRKMEEKTRLYNAMKRGDYIRRDDSHDDRGLVDFDRKWADQEARGVRDDEAETSGSDEDTDEEMVEFEDEFGRTRMGTKAQAAREERRKRIQGIAAEEEERLSARPAVPTNIIYGDTVQHQAFNPDQVIADRMADLAKKRDRSATPPPDTHYDGNAEVRTKGTGFYSFSADAQGRKEEMDALERERKETERVRNEREQKKEARRKELEARRKAIAQQRSKAEADRFLSTLNIPLGEDAGIDTG